MNNSSDEQDEGWGPLLGLPEASLKTLTSGAQEKPLLPSEDPVEPKHS